MTQTCGYFDDPIFGLFDTAIFDCIGVANVPTKIDVTFSEVYKPTVTTSEIYKPTISTSETHKPKVGFSE